MLNLTKALKLNEFPFFIYPDRDPLVLDPFLNTYHVDTYYPPGTVCANDKFKQFCPTSGESGPKKRK